MTFFILGGIAIVIGLALFLASRSQAEHAFILKSSKADNVKDIVSLQSHIASEIGSGSFREFVEVTGMPVADSPLQSELSGTPCLYYNMTVTREWEETVSTPDDKGNKQTTTQRGSDLVSSNTRSINFFLDDGTGKIEIRPEGAQIDLVKAVDTFQPEEGGGTKLSFGKATFELKSNTAGRRTLGYRYQEYVLPANQRLFIFGEASDGGNSLRISRPEKKGLFVISHLSKEEIIQRSQGSSKFLKIASIIFALLGVGGFVLGIFSGS